MKRIVCILFLSAVFFAAFGQESPSTGNTPIEQASPVAGDAQDSGETLAANDTAGQDAAAPDTAPAPGAGSPLAPLSAGIQIEGNMNSPTGYALGFGLSGYWEFSKAISAGLRAVYSNDFAGTGTIEVQPLFRYYLFDLLSPRDSSGLFAQADAGASTFLAAVGTKLYFSGGATAGYRFKFGSWYAEPYVRVGYPVFWGAGVGAGYHF